MINYHAYSYTIFFIANSEKISAKAYAQLNTRLSPIFNVRCVSYRIREYWTGDPTVSYVTCVTENIVLHESGAVNPRFIHDG